MSMKCKNILKIALFLAVCETLIMLLLPHVAIPYVGLWLEGVLAGILDASILTICTLAFIQWAIIKPDQSSTQAILNFRKNDVIKLILIIFINELLLMLVMYWIKDDLNSWQESLIDGVAISLLSAPLIELWIVQGEKFSPSGQSEIGSGPYVFIIAVAFVLASLVFIMMAGIETISGLRAFVSAEGLWSKNQKNAVIHLVRYASSQDDKEYVSFTKHMNILMGYKQARLALQKTVPDRAAAYQGLLDGGSHPLDIKNMAHLFIEFHELEHINKAVQIWEQADSLSVTLNTQAEKLHQLLSTGTPTPDAAIANLIHEINETNNVLTTLEDEFSNSMGMASRWANKILFFFMAGCTIIIICICIWLIIFISKIFLKIQAYNAELLMMSNALQNHSNELEEIVATRTKQLVHAERLATLGTFSAGMAHEINNPNSFITGNVQFLQQFWQLAQPILQQNAHQDGSGRILRFMDEVTKTMDGILDGSARISKIVDSLKTYSKGGMETDRVECRLDDPLGDARNLLQHRMRQEHIIIKTDIQKNLMLYCDRQQVTQVFVNLFNNAMDAMDETTGQSEKCITVEAKIIDKHNWICIKDNGPGIPEAVLGKIFDPFFTTKGKTKGTGLGLSIVEGIVKDHRGQITIHSHPGEETEVIIILPSLELYKEQH